VTFTFTDIIQDDDVLEPETIRSLFPEMDEEDFNWLMALITTKKTTHFLEDMYIFENVIRALNRLPVDFSNVQGVAPKHIWYGVDLIRRISKPVDVTFSWEVKKYIQYTFNEAGLFGLYPYLPIDPDIQEKANVLLDPLSSTSIDEMDRRGVLGQKLAELMLYTTNMRNSEPR